MDTTFIMLSVVFGSIGAGFWIYGKKQQLLIPLVVGLALFVYPYFMPNNWLLIIVGILLTALPFVIRV